MPGRDGTGPFGAGTAGGRRGMRGGIGAGPTGYCICPRCGEKVSHTVAIACTSLKCPKCGSPMVRGS